MAAIPVGSSRYPPLMATVSTGPPSVEDREGAHNRRELRWSTSVNTAGTVVAAILGAILGVVATLISADRDDQRADREFWRAERATLYTDYVAAIDESQLLMQP